MNFAWLIGFVLFLLMVFLLARLAYQRGIKFRSVPAGILCSVFLLAVLIASLVQSRNQNWLPSPAWRFLLFFPWIVFTTWFIHWPEGVSTGQRLAFCLLGVSGVLMLTNEFSQVTAYPFSQYWSEGNTLWMYASTFTGAAPAAYFPRAFPGVYGLWGLPYWIPQLPIQAHRFWSALLNTLPCFLAALGMAVHIRSRWWKVLFILWGAVFLSLGPIYAPLLLAAFLVFIAAKFPAWLRVLLVAAASLYTAMSRYTWILAPAYWAMLLDLFKFFPVREGKLWRRLLPTAGVGLAGVVPAVAYVLFSPAVLADLTRKTTSRFLWYRLFPHPTLPIGLLLEVVIVAGPVFLVLLSLVFQRRWKLDGWQAGFALAGCILTGLAGTIISLKIGGGDNLHNLDMFLITALVLAGLAASDWVSKAGRQPLAGRQLAYYRLLLGLVVLVPTLYWFLKPLTVPVRPDQVQIQEILKGLQREVDTKSRLGDILFMDQRQLYTFGYISTDRFVNDYEKVLVMEHAMTRDEAYFENFYHDLATGRFSLIIVEPLNTMLFGSTHSFGEENDAWAHWVATPIEHYYSLLTDYPQVGIQLYVPKSASAAGVP